MLRTITRPTASRFARNSRKLIAHASSPEKTVQVGSVFPGKYGAWLLTKEDVDEVMLYRASLTSAALCSLLVAPTHIAPDYFTQLNPLLEDALVLIGAGSFGISTKLIHIYMSPVKKAIQALWAFGFLSAIIFSVNAYVNEDGLSLLQYVGKHAHPPYTCLLSQPPTAIIIIPPRIIHDLTSFVTL